LLPPGAPRVAVFSETAKVTSNFQHDVCMVSCHPLAPSLAGAIRLAPLGSIRRPMATRTRVTSAGAVACRLHYPARRAAHFLSFLWCYRNHGFCLTSRLMAYCAPLTTSAFSAMHFPVTLSGALFYASCVLLSRFASGPFTTLLLARPGYQPVWGLHTPYLCSGYRILTDATVGSLWTGVSLCAVYLRL